MRHEHERLREARKSTKNKTNPSLEFELFTLIIRNVKMENSITREIQRYLKPKPRPIPKH